MLESRFEAVCAYMHPFFCSGICTHARVKVYAVVEGGHASRPNGVQG